jgi:nucleoside-diphosphate-sugar epimerase
MRVFVTGASGAVGAYLIPHLVEHGHEVVATTRSQHKVERLRTLGAEPILLDGLDATAVGEAVGRAAPEAIIHEMTALSGKSDLRHFDRWFAATNELRTKGTAHLLAAARASGVTRIVVQGYTGWNNPGTPGPIKTETDGFDPAPLPDQSQTLQAMQRMEQSVFDAPIEGVVLRYANLYGPGGLDTLVAPLKKRMFPIVGDGGGVWSWLHHEDAAIAATDALERAKPGAYNIADDDPAAVNEWLPYLASVVGAPRPFHVPVWLGRLLAGEVAVRMMTEGRGSSNAKAKAEFGWRPTRPSWRQGFRELAPSSARNAQARAVG